jgi:CheY-like chemotaxis protein
VVTVLLTIGQELLISLIVLLAFGWVMDIFGWLMAVAHYKNNAIHRTILLADDEVLGRSVTAALLQRRGHSVTAVESGYSVLDVLQRQKFDIVLTAISMPDLDGMDMARIIRSGELQGIDAQVPIIVLTAHAFVQAQDHFLACGINMLASKPVNFDELLDHIEDLCR